MYWGYFSKPFSAESCVWHHENRFTDRKCIIYDMILCRITDLFDCKMNNKDYTSGTCSFWRDFMAAIFVCQLCVVFFLQVIFLLSLCFFLILCEFHRHEFAGLWFNIPKYTNLLLFDLFVVWIGRMRSRAHLRSVAIFCSIYKLNIFKTYHVCDL